MPTDAKLRWISALAATGLREIEVGSFVPARLLPQMADIREVVAHALAIPGLHVAVLAPNLRGSQSAFEAGVHKVTLPVSVTNEHSMGNIRKTTGQMIDEVREIVALRNARFPHVQIEAGVSVAFGCTIVGAVSDDQTLRMCTAMAECGVDEVGLSDTSGYAILLESMGYDTGIDIDALVAARAILAEALPGEALYGHVQDAGLPKGFR
ncbi:MAG: Pyruvate:Oxaloacetate transcarboxylase domain protein [uncultured Paraburkholderia sp.]|nr:MAG: Pyruvate:Oxaloacetate transcarboxylase domain protein [uncultured Paraburkholderia sp.]